VLTVLIVALFLALPVADLATLAHPPLGVVGMVLWGLAWLALAAWAVASLGRTVRDVARRRPGALSLAAAVFLAAMVLVRVGDVASVHHETTQEIAQTLDQLRNAPDRGFTGTALFGYPARQFLVPALPSLLLGRSALALHLGTAIVFLVALAIFVRGLLDRFGDTRDGDLLVATVLTFVPHIYFFNHFMLFFEQSIFPFLSGMIVVGIALSLDERSPRCLPWLLGIANLTLIHGYTPGLASFLLVEAALVVVAVTRRPAWAGSRPALLAIAGWSAVSLAASLAYRHDLLFGGDKGLAELLADLLLALRHVVVVPFGPENFVSAYLLGFVLVTLAAALAFAAGWRGFAVAGWACAVFLAAVVSKGFSWYEIPMRVHRATVAFPVVLALMACLWRLRIAHWSESRKALLVVAALSLPIGLAFQAEFLRRCEPLLNNVFLEWLRPTLPAETKSVGAGLYLELPEGDTRLENLWDFSQYFEPRLRHTFGVRDQGACDGLLAQLRDEPELVVLVARTADPPWHRCLANWPAQAVGTFEHGGGRPVTIYRLDRPAEDSVSVLHSP
jgi:hypothetical protein